MGFYIDCVIPRIKQIIITEVEENFPNKRQYGLETQEKVIQALEQAANDYIAMKSEPTLASPEESDGRSSVEK